MRIFKQKKIFATKLMFLLFVLPHIWGCSDTLRVVEEEPGPKPKNPIAIQRVFVDPQDVNEIQEPLYQTAAPWSSLYNALWGFENLGAVNVWADLNALIQIEVLGGWGANY